MTGESMPAGSHLLTSISFSSYSGGEICFGTSPVTNTIADAAGYELETDWGDCYCPSIIDECGICGGPGAIDECGCEGLPVTVGGDAAVFNFDTAGQPDPSDPNWNPLGANISTIELIFDGGAYDPYNGDGAFNSVCITDGILNPVYTTEEACLNAGWCFEDFEDPDEYFTEEACLNAGWNWSAYWGPDPNMMLVRNVSSVVITDTTGHIYNIQRPSNWESGDSMRTSYTSKHSLPDWVEQSRNRDMFSEWTLQVFDAPCNVSFEGFSDNGHIWLDVHDYSCSGWDLSSDKAFDEYNFDAWIAPTNYDDPYNNGWLIKVKITNKEEIGDLMTYLKANKASSKTQVATQPTGTSVR